MVPKSFSVRIFLQDGLADGVKVISRSKWSGRGLVIPRAALPVEAERPELEAPGVYLLVDASAVVAVGAAARLGEALLDEAVDPGWETALTFSDKDENLSLVQAGFVRDCLQQRLSGSTSLPATDLSADEQAAAIAFMDYLVSVCPVLNVEL